MRRNSFLLGYRTVTVEESARRAFLTILLDEGIPFCESPDGTFTLSLAAYRRLASKKDIGVVYSSSAPEGALGLVFRLFRIWGLHVGIVLGALFLWYFSGFVLDVRVEGNERTPDAAILSELADAGLSVGMRFSELDFSLIENRLLSNSRFVGWLNLNRRAGVVYVSVREREPVPSSPEQTPSNLVSRADAVVEEILLSSGAPTVAVGDAVTEGQLLISGVLSDGSVVMAEGSVLGRVRLTVETDLPRLSFFTAARTHRCVGVSVNFFAKTINILKTPSNLPENCVIIQDNRKMILPFGRPFPLSVHSTYLVEEHTVPCLLTDDELIARGAALHEQAIADRIREGELLSISTRTVLTENGYRLISEISVLTELVRQVPILTDLQNSSIQE